MARRFSADKIGTKILSERAAAVRCASADAAAAANRFALIRAFYVSIGR